VKEFYDTFGEFTAISSLAVLVERDKLRVLHDGTHKTMVNHRIRCREKLRMPGVREKHCLLRGFRDKKQHPLSILGDVQNAHRLIKIVPGEWGMLGCQLDDHSVWTSLVGTFGIASAAYWWSRLSGCVLRCVYGTCCSMPTTLSVWESMPGNGEPWFWLCSTWRCLVFQ